MGTYIDHRVHPRKQALQHVLRRQARLNEMWMRVEGEVNFELRLKVRLYISDSASAVGRLLTLRRRL